ncbi:hypothetical protein LguiA_026128 [Lonicera macranthoides]
MHHSNAPMLHMILCSREIVFKLMELRMNYILSLGYMKTFLDFFLFPLGINSKIKIVTFLAIQYPRSSRVNEEQIETEHISNDSLKQKEDKQNYTQF